MLLLSRRCLALICISERAKLLQYESLDRWVIEGRLPQKNADRIKAKTFVLPPPQHRLAPPRTRSEDDSLRIIFVGNMFFLKGGRELFHACEHLIQQGAALELFVVSTIESDDWFSHTRHSDELEWKMKLESEPWVEHMSNLPNGCVLNLLLKCHVAALPTRKEFRFVPSMARCLDAAHMTSA